MEQVLDELSGCAMEVAAVEPRPCPTCTVLQCTSLISSTEPFTIASSALHRQLFITLCGNTQLRHFTDTKKIIFISVKMLNIKISLLMNESGQVLSKLFETFGT